MSETVDKGYIVRNILAEIQSFIDPDKMRLVEAAIYKHLNDLELHTIETSLVVSSDINTQLVQRFLVAKKVKGCTHKTLQAYTSGIRFLFEINKNFTEITSDDIRYLLAVKQLQGWQATNANNNRRIWSSFFGWLTREDYIAKNPMDKIDKIKEVKAIKKAFSEIEVEKMRRHLYALGEETKTDKLTKMRNIAIFEMLLSTGVRISELIGIANVAEDSNIESMIVFGKGQKEREVFLNAKAVLAVREWVKIKKEYNIASPYLFCSVLSPYEQLQIAGVEIMVRELGRTVGVEKAHPHRYRRTAATWALRRGMPIDQVKQMLGHESISTTTIYAKSDISDVKTNHNKVLT